MSDHWIAAWGLPIAKPPRTCAEWVHDTTVRFTMLMTVPGKSLKFHFSNLFGEHEATISRASVSVQTEGSSIDVCRFAAITFNGAESGTMAAGEGIVSDPADLVYEAGETLTVSLPIFISSDSINCAVTDEAKTTAFLSSRGTMSPIISLSTPRPRMLPM